MAEAPDPDVVEKGLEELEEEITCPVCQDHFREPKILPCLHYYCKECVRQLALRARPNRPFFRQSNERAPRKSGESAGKDGSCLRNVFWSESRSVLPPMYEVYLQRLRELAPKDEGIRWPQGRNPSGTEEGRL